MIVILSSINQPGIITRGKSAVVRPGADSFAAKYRKNVLQKAAAKHGDTDNAF
jgi:hypothetical protein